MALRTAVLNAPQPRATREGISADARDATGTGNARKARATIEGIIADARNASVCGDNAVFTTENKRFACRFNQAVSCAMILCIAVSNGNARKARATLEGIRVDARDAIGNGNARKAYATIEGIPADARDTVGNRDGCQTRAIYEGIVADARDTVGNCDGGSSGVMRKGRGVNFCHPAALVNGRDDDIDASFRCRAANGIRAVSVGREVEIVLVAFAFFVRTAFIDTRNEDGGLIRFVFIR